jgi:hypothetical protein
MDHPLPWLRYVDADDLHTSAVDFGGMNVDSVSGDKLGDVDGFIVDVASGRPYYVAVDAGGWFKSKFFLLPIGHVSFDRANKRLISDVPRDRVERYPGFDRDEFEKLSDDQLRTMDESIVGACCPGENMTSTSRFDQWAHYRKPTWWEADFYRPDRADRMAKSVAGTWPEPRETGLNREADRSRELITAHGGDVSPQTAGRAQPGDIIGLDSGGETTHIGDTPEDEDERRRAAERAASKARK